MRVSRRITAMVEGSVLAAVAVVTVAHFVRFARAMATTSLWNDEIFSIDHFSSQGWWTTVTNYPVANNHIFFNLLNALTPGGDLYDPLRARLWAILAVAAAVLVPTVWLIRRRRWLEAALVLQLLGMNAPLLDLGLQARGYGLLFLFAASLCCLVARHVRIDDERSASAVRAERWLIGAIAVLGVWTMPIFALFVAPLLAVLLVARRTRATLVLLAGSGIAALLLYAPVLRELLAEQSGYAEQWGQQYATLASVQETFATFLFNPPAMGGAGGIVAMLVVLGVLALAAIPLARTPGPEGVAALLLLLACAAFLALCLAIGTPPVRSTAFVVVPVVLACMFAFGALAPPARSGLPRAALALALAWLVLPADVARVRDFRFTPRETWMEVAHFADQVLPQGTALCVPFRSDQLAVYLRPGRELFASCDAEAVRSGEVAFVQNGMDASDEVYGRVADVLVDSAAFVFPQRRGGHQTLSFMPPAVSRVTGVVAPRGRGSAAHPALAADGDRSTRWSIGIPQSAIQEPVEVRVQIEPGRAYRSLLSLHVNGDQPREVDVMLRLADGRTLPPASAPWMGGDFMVIALGDQAVEEVVFTVGRAAHDVDRYLSFDEIWALPTDG